MYSRRPSTSCHKNVMQPRCFSKRKLVCRCRWPVRKARSRGGSKRTEGSFVDSSKHPTSKGLKLFQRTPPALSPPRSLTCALTTCTELSERGYNHLFQCLYRTSYEPPVERVGSRAHPTPSQVSGCQSTEDTFLWQQYRYHHCLTLCPLCPAEEYLCRAIPMPSIRRTAPSRVLLPSRNGLMPQYNAKMLMDNPHQPRSRC